MSLKSQKMIVDKAFLQECQEHMDSKDFYSIIQNLIQRHPDQSVSIHKAVQNKHILREDAFYESDGNPVDLKALQADALDVLAGKRKGSTLAQLKKELGRG